MEWAVKGDENVYVYRKFPSLNQIGKRIMMGLDSLELVQKVWPMTWKLKFNKSVDPYFTVGYS